MRCAQVVPTYPRQVSVIAPLPRQQQRLRRARRLHEVAPATALVVPLRDAVCRIAGERSEVARIEARGDARQPVRVEGLEQDVLDNRIHQAARLCTVRVLTTPLAGV